MLERYVVDYVKSYGIDELWLFTEFARGLYEKSGWVFVEDVWHNGSVHALMKYKFDC